MSYPGPNPLAPGTLVHERYRVVAPVGRGGLGTVYQVTDALFGPSSIYALKEQWDLSDSARKQFAREGAWLKNLDHNSIPKVREYFEWSGRLYLVMDFVDGESLEQKLDRGGGRPLPEGQVLTWILPICDALTTCIRGRPADLCIATSSPRTSLSHQAGHRYWWTLASPRSTARRRSDGAPLCAKPAPEGYAPPNSSPPMARPAPGRTSTAWARRSTSFSPPGAADGGGACGVGPRGPRPRELNPVISCSD